MAKAVPEYSKLEFRIPGTEELVSLTNSRRRATRAMSTVSCTTALILRTVHDSAHSVVYRALIDDRQVIIKRSVYNGPKDRSYTDLETEAHVYRVTLAKLQGTVIPHFYGFYRSPKDSNEKICCIVLEDCGNSVPCFYKLNADVKLKIMQLVKGLHDKGYALRDFAERNVVCRKGNYRLIDFDDIETHDSCDWDGDLHFNESTPTSEVCRYMLERGLDMHFWPVLLPPSVDIGGTPCPMQWYPPQTTIDALLSGLSEDDVDLNFEYVQAILLEYQANIAAGRKVDFDAARTRIHQLPLMMPKRALPFNNVNSSYTPVC